MTSSHCPDQSGVSSGVLHVDQTAVLDQRLREPEVALPSCVHERGIAPGVLLVNVHRRQPLGLGGEDL